ncbi:MAG: nuclease-related domain-containing protein [Gammaproteobacteria bacterium]
MNEYLMNPLVWAGAIFVLLVGIVWFWRRLVRMRSVPYRLESAVQSRKSNFLIPNGEGGEIFIEHALLTSTGVVLVDVKDISGNVFGSDGMDDWTVFDGKARYTITNPQYGLFDRMAAMKSLMPDVPVSGFVAFTKLAMFPKGRPENTVMFDALVSELGVRNTGGQEAAIGLWKSHWDAMESQASESDV